MREQIEVIFENGVFKPLTPVPASLKDRQQLTVTIEGPNGSADWLADANSEVSLEEVRRALSKVKVSGTELVNAEREER
jgi:predicted DNA-binding antitoxin AbrB/MazE fold protein